MAEMIQRAGTWAFDGDTLRIVPGTERNVHQLRKTLGEVAVPLHAVSGIAFEPGKKGGRLRIRLRDGADPLAQVAGGRLPDASDPYQLAVEKDRTGVAEYFVDEVRHALLLESVPDTPLTRYLLPGPSVPLTANGSDGAATFDGERIQLEWNWMAEESKTHSGRRSFSLQELDGVEWTPAIGWENGSLRFHPKGRHPVLKPQYDPNCLSLWGIRQARETGGSALLAAAVMARLPHPLAPAATATDPAALAGKSDGTGVRARAEADDAADHAAASTADRPNEQGTVFPEGAAAGNGPIDGPGHDNLLRRLRELGELHSSGVLTDSEFATAKKAVLEQF